MEARRKLYEVLKNEYEKIISERGVYQYIIDNPNATNDEAEKEEAKAKLTELEESAEVFKAEVVSKAKAVVADFSKEIESVEKSKKGLENLVVDFENKIKEKEKELKLILKSEGFANKDEAAISTAEYLEGEIDYIKNSLEKVRSKVTNLEKQIQEIQGKIAELVQEWDIEGIKPEVETEQPIVIEEEPVVEEEQPEVTEEEPVVEEEQPEVAEEEPVVAEEQPEVAEEEPVVEEEQPEVAEEEPVVEEEQPEVAEEEPVVAEEQPEVTEEEPVVEEEQPEVTEEEPVIEEEQPRKEKPKKSPEVIYVDVPQQEEKNEPKPTKEISQEKFDDWYRRAKHGRLTEGQRKELIELLKDPANYDKYGITTGIFSNKAKVLLKAIAKPLSNAKVYQYGPESAFGLNLKSADKENIAAGELVSWTKLKDLIKNPGKKITAEETYKQVMNVDKESLTDEDKALYDSAEKYVQDFATLRGVLNAYNQVTQERKKTRNSWVKEKIEDTPVLDAAQEEQPVVKYNRPVERVEQAPRSQQRDYSNVREVNFNPVVETEEYEDVYSSSEAEKEAEARKYATKSEQQLVGNLEETVEYLQECKKNGKNVYIDFNNHRLYSDDVTLESAYMQVVGMPKAEHEEFLTKYTQAKTEVEKEAIAAEWKSVKVKNTTKDRKVTVENPSDSKAKKNTGNLSIEEMINQHNKEEAEKNRDSNKKIQEAEENLNKSRNNFFNVLAGKVNDTDTVPSRRTTPSTSSIEHQEP